MFIIDKYQVPNLLRKKQFKHIKLLRFSSMKLHLLVISMILYKQMCFGHWKYLLNSSETPFTTFSDPRSLWLTDLKRLPAKILSTIELKWQTLKSFVWSKLLPS